MMKSPNTCRPEGGEMPSAIEVEGLTKEYGPVKAVRGIHFQVPEGSVFAFLGPNGAGKTTTTEILEGLRRATQGTIRVLGRDPWTEGRALHNETGVIPQDFHFFEKITAREAITYYAALFHVPARVDELLQRVALSEKADARFDTLSGGQKQKLGLALALVNDPRICFLDEPTTGLDPHARRAIWAVIRQLREERRTVFLTTHYLEEAELLADRVAIIHHGQIIAEGSPEEIIKSHGGPQRLVVQGSSAVAEFFRTTLKVRPTIREGQLEIPISSKEEGLSYLDSLRESGLPWDGFTVERDTLEDVFIRLVGQMDDGVLKSEATL